MDIMDIAAGIKEGALIIEVKGQGGRVVISNLKTGCKLCVSIRVHGRFDVLRVL